MNQLVAFLAVSAIVIVTPGQDTALTIRNSLLGGRRAGIFTALGVSAGQACWTVAASAGVAALLVASEPAFVALKLLGAAYLVFLGVQALYDAFVRGAGRATQKASSAPRVSPLAAFRQGVVSNLGNPKMAVFFTSLLPQFTASGEASFGALLALGLLFCLMTLVWLSAYSFAVAKAGHLLRRPKVRRTLNAVLGTVLVALGARLATQER